MKRAFTLVELLIGMGLMALLVLGSLTMFASSLRSLQRTTNDVTITDQNARALRKISESVRNATSVTVSSSGLVLTYTLPKMTTAVDPVTGEKEVVVPPVSDGITRSYTVDFTAGTLRDSQSNRVMVQDICRVDPDAGSTLYNQNYQPFQISSIDTHKAVTINLVTRDATSGQPRIMRMKTTAILRNTQ